MVGPVVGLPALLLSASGDRPTGADLHRQPRPAGIVLAGIVLVLLPDRQRVLSDRSHVLRGVDQGPAAGRVASDLLSAVFNASHVQRSH